MAHKLIPKKDLPHDFHLKKKKRGQEEEMGRYRHLRLVKGARREMFGGSKVKDEMRGGERVLYALALIEIFGSLLSGRAGVSVVPNGVIKGINLRQVLICCAYHGIFIRYDHHSVMKLLITSDKHCDVGMKADASVEEYRMEMSHYHVSICTRKHFMK